jgi:excinuclease ABC subunit C
VAAEAAGFDPQRLLAELPRRPGVYQMCDAGGRVLYVGKARNLEARVSSYFRGSGLTARTLALVRRIADIRVTVTASETEALLLEQSLIKSEKPPYNIVLRDDKSYPYLHLTADAEFPRLAFHRGARARRGRYFGPFPSAYAVRESLNVLQKLFRIRQCDNATFRNRSRPCLQHQIGRCTAPCVGLVTPQEYQADVARAVKFLEGRSDEVLAEYKTAMDAAAAALEF